MLTIYMQSPDIGIVQLIRYCFFFQRNFIVLFISPIELNQNLLNVSMVVLINLSNHGEHQRHMSMI